MGLRLPLYLCGFCSIPAWLLVKTSGKVDGLEIFSFEGSSSMKATIDFLVSEYNKQGNQIFSNVQAVGSNSGLERLLEGYADFALVSQDVKELAEKYKDSWDRRQLRTITLAKEAMVLLYKPPANCSDPLDITVSNVKHIYSAFSGYKHKDSKDLDWSKLINKCSGKITTWVKSSGPTRSGTAYTFVNNPELSKLSDDINWLEKVKKGYGDDFKNIKYTSESNLLSWNSFVADLIDGSMIYLPSSFVFTNIANINDKGIKIAKLNGQEISLENFKNSVSEGEKYQWGRTYNLIYSTSSLSPKKKQFVEWLLKNLSIVQGMNLIPISESQAQDKDKSDQELGKYGGISFLVSQTSRHLQQLIR